MTDTTDTRILVDVAGISSEDHRAIARECWLALMNAGGLDGDWIEIQSEVESRGWDAMEDYFRFSDSCED